MPELINLHAYMFKAATIKDIAKELGLSASTVSRALLDSYEVSAETKKKVTEYAQKINYYSNPAARSLKNSRSYSVGVMVADVANSFFSQTINGIESVAYEKGYNVIITQSHDQFEREALNLDHLAGRSVDGILISMAAQTKDYSHLISLHEQGLPIVFFDRILEQVETFKVTTNNYKAARDATSLLIGKGYCRIAHIANAPQLSITVERLEGYKDALRSAGISYDEKLVRFCLKGGKEQTEVDEMISYLATLSKKPDALFISSDRLCTNSLRSLNTCFQAENFVVIGFSNSDIIDLLSPKISYVRQKAFEMGAVAMQMLLQLIESKHPVYEFETRRLDAEFFWHHPQKG